MIGYENPLSRLTAVLTAAALLLALGCSRSRRYAQVAEGLSSGSGAESMKVASRMFSAPDLEQQCNAIPKAFRLVVRPARIQLALGDVYALSSLSVMVLDEAGVAIPQVPIAIEVEDISPALVRLRSDDPDLLSGRIRTVARGRFGVRVRAICGTPAGYATIEARVH